MAERDEESSHDFSFETFCRKDTEYFARPSPVFSRQGSPKLLFRKITQTFLIL